jgi:phospholipid transport system substrate-binding protein
MNRRAGLLAVVCLVAAAMPAAAAKKDESASATVKRANERFQELLAKKVEAGSEDEKKLAAQVTKEMRELFDIRDLARRALVDHWDKMTRAQQDEIVSTFQSVIEKSYVKSLRANLQYQVEYGAETKSKDSKEVLVKTVIKAKKSGRDRSIAVDYRMTHDGKSWRVFDVLTDDVSMLANYRSQFNRIIAKEGIDGLLARMRKKLAEN